MRIPPLAAAFVVLTVGLVGCTQDHSEHDTDHSTVPSPTVSSKDPEPETSCSGDTEAAGALELRANATPPKQLPSGTLRIEAASQKQASFHRTPDKPESFTVKVGGEFGVGGTTYRLVASCAVTWPEGYVAPPGSTHGIAYVVQV